MLHQIWFMMMGASMLYGCLTQSAGEMLEAALAGCRNALDITLELCAGYMFFCGLMNIARALKAGERIGKLLSPLLGRLMPSTRTSEAREAASMNLAMNVLGMGNAATPMGLEAMRRLEAERSIHPGVRHDMEMLLILNATSLQLIPSTVLAMRAAAGSASPGSVLGPTILCTAFSTLVGVTLGLVCRKLEENRDG